MTITDELRIAAFQIGNRSYNPMIITLCLAIVPEMISTIREDFKRGRRVIPLNKVDLQNFAETNLTACRKILNIPPPCMLKPSVEGSYL